MQYTTITHTYTHTHIHTRPQVEYCNNENTVVKKTLVECDNEYRRPNEGASVTLRVTGVCLVFGGISIHVCVCVCVCVLKKRNVCVCIA